MAQQEEDREIPLSFPPNINKYLHCAFTINKRHHPSIATQMQTSRIKMNILRLNASVEKLVPCAGPQELCVEH